MAEYIDRQEAILALLDSPTLSGGLVRASDVLKRLPDVPIAGVAPVVHGRWDMEVKGKPNDGGTSGINVCSVCGHSQHISAKGNYCPNCGANMGKEE